VYAVAAYSGFRRSELKRLQKQDCDPTGERPCWKVRAEVPKNGQAADLLMTQECAAALLAHWQALPRPDSPFLQRVPFNTTVQQDIEGAGIERQDRDGRWADFHSLRYTFCRLLSPHLPIELVKTLMRHPTTTLTVDLHGALGLKDIGSLVWTLPPLLSPARAGPGGKGEGNSTDAVEEE
jgi:integrase